MKPIFETGKEHEIGNNESFKVIDSEYSDYKKDMVYTVSGIGYRYCTERLLQLAFIKKRGLYCAIHILDEEQLAKLINSN